MLFPPLASFVAPVFVKLALPLKVVFRIVIVALFTVTVGAMVGPVAPLPNVVVGPCAINEPAPPLFEIVPLLNADVPLEVKVNPFRFIVAPVLTVILFTVAFAVNTTLLLPAAIVTLSPATGLPDGDQLALLVQLVLEVPVHV